MTFRLYLICFVLQLSSFTIEGMNLLGIPDSIYDNPTKCIKYCKEALMGGRIEQSSEEYYSYLIEIYLAKSRLGELSYAEIQLKSLLMNRSIELTIKQKVYLYKSLARINELLGKYETSILFGDTTIYLAEKNNFKLLLGSGYLNRGNGYACVGNLERSLQDYHRAMEIFKDCGEITLYSKALGNIGNIYIRLGNLQKAAEYYDLQYSQLDTTTVTETLIINFGNRAFVQIELGDLSGKPEDLLLKSLDMTRENSLVYLESWVLNTLGVFYQRKKEFRKALETHRQALQLAIKTSNSLEETRILGSLSSNFLRLNNKDSAEYYMMKSIQNARVLKDTTLILSVLESSSSVASELGNWEFATRLINEWKEIYKSNLDREKIRALSDFQAKYDNAQLSLRNAEQEIELDNYKIAVLTITLLLLIVVLIFLFIRIHVIRKHKKLEFEIGRLKSEVMALYKDDNVFSIENLKRALPATSSLSLQDYELIELLLSSNGNLNNKEMASRLQWSEHTLRYHKKKLVQEFEMPGADNQQLLEAVLTKIKNQNKK